MSTAALYRASDEHGSRGVRNERGSAHGVHLPFDRDGHDGAPEKGFAQRLAARRPGPRSGRSSHRGPGVHDALRAGPRGPCDARVPVVLEVHAVCDRGDCLRAPWRWFRRAALSTQASSATSCARGWFIAASAGSSPMERSGTWRACAAPACPSGAPASRRRPRSPNSPSWTGSSRSAAAGVAIFPDDILIADHDGAVVIPKAMAQDVLESGRETEALEEWILEQVNSGRKLPGLYPPNEDAKAEFRSWRSRR